jgi:acetyl esterase/lipase
MHAAHIRRPLPRLSLALGLLAFAVLFGAAPAAAQPTHANLAYGPHARHKLDLYIPAGASPPRPLVVWIHGGGWQGGDKYPANQTPILVQAGFAVASINYRLSSDATYPGQIHDCKAAVRWLRANAATYNLDPSRVGAWGSSAGGHLSALVGTTGGNAELEGDVGGNLAYSSRVRAAADYFGPTDFFTMGGNHDSCTSPESRLLGECLGLIKQNMNDPNWAFWVDRVRDCGAYYQVSPDDPPFHIAHGSADNTVPPGQSQQLYDALLAAGVPATLRIVPGAGHGLPTSEQPFVRDFFLLHLGAAPVRGDANCDGALTFDDIDPFVDALLGEESFIADHPDCNWYHADCNADGRVTFDDIDAFVALLGA